MAPERMAVMQLVRQGGVERLFYRTDVPVPRPSKGVILVKFTAKAKNNTDRKVREGLYPTERHHDVTSFQISGRPTLEFSRIQGGDVVGRASAAEPGAMHERNVERGLLDFSIYLDGRRDLNLVPDRRVHHKRSAIVRVRLKTADWAGRARSRG